MGVTRRDDGLLDVGHLGTRRAVAVLERTHEAPAVSIICSLGLDGSGRDCDRRKLAALAGAAVSRVRAHHGEAVAHLVDARLSAALDDLDLSDRPPAVAVFADTHRSALVPVTRASASRFTVGAEFALQEVRDSRAVESCHLALVAPSRDG